MRTKLLLLAFIFISFFTFFSYTVAKEQWTQIDFDNTVKMQDHVSRKFDKYFTYFTILGSAEVTIGFCLIMVALSLLKLRILPVIGWLMIIPASMGEIFGKLILFHPGPPVFLHRSVLPSNLPMFYVHTDYSYPSGHMTRTFFIITVLACIVIFKPKKHFNKTASIAIMISLALSMAITRVYLGEHWTSDVIGGSILGLAFGCFASVLILRHKRIKIEPNE